MGNSKNYKQKFYATHTICCFCGGNSPATTIDHIPARATFNNRSWPEGYDFPACQKCNSTSAQNEQIVATLARLGAVNPSPAETLEYQKLLQGLKNNHPEVLTEMRATPNQVRAFMRHSGGRLGDGLVSSDVPILSVKGPLVRAAVDEFARKLLLALHYKHTGKIVPSNGGIAFKWVTNSVKNNEQFLKDIEDIRHTLFNTAKMQRSNTRLESQFSYKYFTDEHGTFSAYFIVFRESFLIIGNVRTDATDFPDVIRESGLLVPYE